jgi:hypothetical protein
MKANIMDLSTIYSEFKALETPEEKVNYLLTLKEFNLPYDLNFDNLINSWSKR